MSGFEWFLVIVVVILIPLVVAVAVTLWTLEMARRRNPRNRPGGKVSGTKRRGTRPNAPSDATDAPAASEQEARAGDR
ncbi:MAG TPA: hypothetical protein VGR22_00985 [Thermomicrobiales bacterium]|nr:hypothetical protein [Thermomicrobiales bacterium]